MTEAPADRRIAAAAAEESGMSAIERREARRRATTPMADKELARWIEFENEHFEKYGPAREDHMPVYMAQSGLHQATVRGRSGTTLVVIVQSSRLDHSPSRLVVPLRRFSPRKQVTASMAVVVHDEEYSLQVQQVCPALRRSPGGVVASFEDAGQPILQAIDDGITTAYG